MKDIYKILNQVGIKYEKYEHPAVFTVQEAERYARGDGAQSKNLFLRNKKGDEHFLIILPSSKQVDLAKLGGLLGGNHLSFASGKRLEKYLGVTAGSVSPFGLVNDVNKEVQVIVDNELLKHKKQGFHPNINTTTLVISTSDFQKFLSWTKNPIDYLDLLWK